VLHTYSCARFDALVTAVKAKTACVAPDAECFATGTCDQKWLQKSGGPSGDLSTTALQSVWDSGDASLETFVVDNRHERCDQLKMLDNIHRAWHHLDSTCAAGNYSLGGTCIACKEPTRCDASNACKSGFVGAVAARP
jgi:hypothetical protein